jgi:hypothetical protein
LSPFIGAAPLWVHQASTVATFAIELGAPWLIYFRRTRLLAAAAFGALSFAILMTGNYTIFNWLTLSLCFWLIPDSYWIRLVDILRLPLRTVPPVASPVPTVTFGAVALTLLSVFWCCRWALSGQLEAKLAPALEYVHAYHVSSPYGLFAVMTTQRPEIVIEGSNDGVTWQEYEFNYKPGGLYRPPAWVAPHQPRLDWQMWFAALGSSKNNRWLEGLFLRLFENTPEVLEFFAWNPFPTEAPKYLRARIYEYKFASVDQIVNEGQWWTRSLRGEYTPVYQSPALSSRQVNGSEETN